MLLVFCQPEKGLHKKYPSVVTFPQLGEIPLGLLYIGASLEGRGHKVQILDDTIELFSKNQLVKKLVAAKPMLVGFSVTCLNVKNFREIAEAFKRECPQVPVVVGGPHVTLLPEAFIALPFVDYVVKGEGELSLCAIAENVRCGIIPPLDGPRDKLIIGKHAPSLDSLPFPARHLVDLTRYRTKSCVMDVQPTYVVCTSRGCPFGCTFCSSKKVWGRHYYRRSPQNVVDEIELLMKNYGARGIYFREDNFTVDRKHVLEICSEIKKRQLDISWECESRIDTIDRQTLAIMRDAGCAGLWSGVESGSQRILDKVCKGIQVDQVPRFFGWCKELGISAGACFMLGFPGEELDDIRATYELAISLPIKWASFATYFGFPGSELYDEIIERNLYEATWEDIYISRNENFSSAQLYSLEAAMNRDARNLLEQNHYQNTYAVRRKISSCYRHLKNRLKNFSKGYIISARRETKFCDLLKQYSSNK